MSPSNSGTTEYSIFNRQQSVNNNEILIAIWLQTGETTTNGNIDSIKSKIEDHVDLLKTLVYDPDVCEKAILSKSNHTKIFLILSNKYVPTVLESFHDISMIHSIYIHDETLNKEQVNGKYSKVINVYKDLNDLADELCSIVCNYIRYAQLPITILKQQNEQDRTTNPLNKFAYFVDFWNPLYLDLLFDLPIENYDQQKANFIGQCRISCRANPTELKKIDDFEQRYKPYQSIGWYKADSFVYRLLNRVTRQQNLEGILLLRFFILDLCKQLNQTYQLHVEFDHYVDNTQIYVYRGQSMFVDEVENLKRNLIHGTIISVTSFFSASRNQNVALRFSGTAEHQTDTKCLPSNKKSVLFEIEITIDHKNIFERKPFADVGAWEDNNELDEQEVIFMAGSFFRIKEITENKLGTLVKMTLVNEMNSNIPILNDYRTLKTTKTIEGKIIRIGNLLIDHSLSTQSSSSKADRYYNALINDSELMMKIACLTGRSWVALKRKQYDLALQLAFEALSINNKHNEELTVTILNCLGGIYSNQNNYYEALKYYTQAYDLSKPTDEKILNRTYKGPCIPIDKYAMYDNYRNIASINKACIHQKLRQVEQAWHTYKEAVDCDMRNESTFHCHTCMTIAEAGTHENISTPEEHNQRWEDWKNFLELGIADLLKYRTPAITGYLSLSQEYDFPSRRYNNSYCREKAIEYFRKVETYCAPQAQNYHYYLYTLQCYQRLAELYQYQDNRSIEYYEKMINLCLRYRSDDFDNMIIAYKGMIDVYTKQQNKKSTNSEDIFILLCMEDSNEETTNVIIPSTPGSASLFENFKPLHFAFDWQQKSIDSRLKDELNLQKKIIYCKMKLAVLLYAQEKIKEARKVLTESIFMCQLFISEMDNVKQICQENLDFIDHNFHPIIQSYKNRLSIINQHIGGCIDEDMFIYIAHLYEKQNDLTSACEYLQEALFYFEQYDYVCTHTIDCYLELVKLYQTIDNDKESMMIQTYERGIRLIKKHRSQLMRMMITIIEDDLIDNRKRINDFDSIIIIYKILFNIVRYNTIDLAILYNYLKQILELFDHKQDLSNTILNIYETFLNFILQKINPLSTQMSMVLTHFRDHALKIYRTIDIYQSLIKLLLQPPRDTIEIINVYKKMAAELKTQHMLEDSVIVYLNLLKFMCHHRSTGGFIEDDLIHFVFYVWKHEIIKEYRLEMKFDLAIDLHYQTIHFLEDYRNYIHKKFKLNDFISEILQSYDEIAIIYRSSLNHIDKMINVYQEEINFLTKYNIECVQERINTIFSKCQRFAEDHSDQANEINTKLIIFIENNRLDYLSDLFIAYHELIRSDYSNEQTMTICHSNSTKRIDSLKRRIFDYKQKAQYYCKENRFDRAKKVYTEELLPFLLEYHARDDHQIATCYLEIAILYHKQNEKHIEQVIEYYRKAIDIYEKQTIHFYTEYAFQLNPNVCRRYAGTLFQCYNCMATVYSSLKDENLTQMYKQKALNIYKKHQDQFDRIFDSVKNEETIKIRPFIELCY